MHLLSRIKTGSNYPLLSQKKKKKKRKKIPKANIVDIALRKIEAWQNMNFTQNILLRILGNSRPLNFTNEVWVKLK